MASSLLLSTLVLVSSAIASPPGYGSHHSSPNNNNSSCASSTAPAPTATDPATCSATRSTAYSAWSYTVETSTRYATPLPSPLSVPTSYAPHFSEASSLLPANATYTSYSLNRNATALQDGQYGQGAYARLWATVSFNHSVPFTTTASPTPVASSELIYPPALYTACPDSADTCIDCYKLPEDFVWGVASSAFQIEGGLTEDGRGPGAFDTIGAVGYVGRAPNEADSEVANMAYYLYKQDIARLAAIGVPYFGFSMSWTRIVPFGTVGSPINQAGLDHYEDVIETCLEYGVKPIVTLTHFDPPLGLQYNSTDFPDAFLYYSKQVMTRFGDRVQEWATLNEPNGVFQNDFPSVPNILMAHAKVYHWYKEELGGTGSITIKFANNLGTPLDNANPDDVRAALRYQDYILGLFANPIFLGENYPEEVTSITGVNLTLLTDEELAYINGTSDVWSFDPYTTGFVTSPPGGIDACASNNSHPLWPTCVVNTNVQSDGWLNGQGSYAYAYIAPQYVRQQLGYVWNVFKPKGTSQCSRRARLNASR
jgi:beta-glucosidase/6-phospho-beta-glucosidase/beta-galactosidase